MKKTLRRISPNPERLREHKSVRWLSAHLHDPSLWNFNRRSIAKGFAVGLFLAFMPVPVQMILAAVGAVVFSANMPISVMLVWVTNPLTMPAIFYACYQLGAWILNAETTPDFAFSFAYLKAVFPLIWQPFLLGCFIVSATASLFGYGLVNGIYRLNIYRYQQSRKR